MQEKNLKMDHIYLGSVNYAILENGKMKLCMLNKRVIFVPIPMRLHELKGRRVLMNVYVRRIFN